MTWQSSLEHVLKSACDTLEKETIHWVVIGSVASALQGCRIVPHDIDIVVSRYEEVARFADLLADFAPESCEFPLGDENWRSSKALPIGLGPDSQGFVWHFGRWYIDEFKVEVANIEPPQGREIDANGIWEAGPGIWPYVRSVEFSNYHVPVIPLEIQLETALSRGLSERVDQMVSVLRRAGCDRQLLMKSLSKKHLDFLGDRI